MDLTKLSAAKRALLDQRLKGGLREHVSAPQIPPRPDAASAPLSYAQRHMWVLDQLAPGNPACNLLYGWRIRGRLDVAALEAGFNALIRRHETLRTTFTVQNGEPLQCIHPGLRIRLVVTSLKQLHGPEQEARLQALASEESIRPFDLARLPLLRASLFELQDAEHVLIVNLHHLVADGLSIGLLMRELDLLYRESLGEHATRLASLPLQYGDYAHWQQTNTANDPMQARQVEFWKRKLGGALPPLNLPADRPRPGRKTFRGSNVFFRVPAALAAQLGTVAARERCTVFMALLATFQVLLHRHSGAEDFVILSPVGSRSPADVEPLIGDFLNLVALRCDVSGDPTFAALLRRSRDIALDAFSNADVPFEVLLEQLTLERDPNRGPLFPVMLQMLPAAPPRLGDLEVSSFHFDRKSAQLDLSLHLYQEADGSLEGRLEYCTDLFEHDTVEQLCSGFRRLLQAVAEDSQSRLSQFPALPGEDRKRRARPGEPASVGPGAARAAPVPPRTRTEQMVLEAFRDCLKRTDFGVLDGFFDLGGYSLAAARLMLHLGRTTGLDLPLAILFEHPTTERLAEAIDMLSWATNAGRASTPAGERVEIEL